MLRATRRFDVLLAICIFSPITLNQASGEDKPLPAIVAPAGRGDGVFLGPWLEEHFQRMIMSCSPTGSRLQLTRIKKDSPFDVSAVPKDLRLALALTDAGRAGSKISVRDGRSVMYLFGNVYTPQEAETVTILDNLAYLDTVREDSPDFVTMPRVDQALLVQTCATTMNAALEANAGYTIPVVSLKGGFGADYRSSGAFALNLIRSTFRSPLLVAYGGIDGPAQSSFNAAMTLVSWYISHPARLNVKNRLLDNFEGVALYQQAGLKRNTTLSASASASGGIPMIARADSVVKANAEWLTDFSASNYSIAILQSDAGLLSAQTVPMPTLADAVAKANTTGRITLDRQRNGEDLTLYDRSPRILDYVLERLPAKLCGAGWRLAQGSSTPFIGAILGAPTPGRTADGWPSCRFSVTFRPSTSMSLDQDRTMEAVFELPVGTSPDSTSVRLAAEPLTFRPIRYPHLGRMSSDVRPVASEFPSSGGAVRSMLTWRSTYQLTDNNLVASDASIDITGLSVRCTPAVAPIAWVEPRRIMTVRPSNDMKVAELTMQVEWNGSYAVARSAPHASCTLGGPVVYTLKNGHAVTKDFPDLRFEYPVEAR